MFFAGPANKIDEVIKNNPKLEAAFASAEVATSSATLKVVRYILQCAIDGEERLFPTREHPYLEPDRLGYYVTKPLPELPEDVEVALRILLDDATHSRLLHQYFDVYFTLMINPFKGGVLVRGLLSVPGGTHLPE